MKNINKIIMIFVISILAIPKANATCSIKSEMCLSDIRSEYNSTFQPDYSVKHGQLGSSDKLNPIKRNDLREELNNSAGQNSNYSYNTSCQFGVCLPNRVDKLFPAYDK